MQEFNQERIRNIFRESIQTQISSMEILAPSILRAVDLCIRTFLNGNKILICANGIDSIVAQQFTTRLIYKSENQRPNLPIINLNTNPSLITQIITSSNFNEIYSQQIQAFGIEQDVLVVIDSQNKNNGNIIKAMQMAINNNMNIIALTGFDNNITNFIDELDIEVQVPSINSIHIHNSHLLAINIICDGIESKFS